MNDTPMKDTRSFSDILTATPEEIQAWLDQRLENAPDEIQAVIESIDYVEPGSLRRPECRHYFKLGEYGMDDVEIAFQVRAGVEAPIALFLKLL